MLRVCSVCDSNINFSINADTDIREFAAMSSRPVSRVQQRLFERAAKENDVHNVLPFDLPAILFLTDDKATLTEHELSFLKKQLAEFPILVSAESDPDAIQKIISETRIDTVVVAASADQNLSDALKDNSAKAAVLHIA